MKKSIPTLALAVLLLPVSGNADSFPPGILGTYSLAPICEFDFVVTVRDTEISVRIGGDEMILPDWDVCLTCMGGAQYQGIAAMSYPRLSNDINPLFIFNADEQPGKLTIEYNGSQPIDVMFDWLIEASPLQKCQM